MQQLGSRVGWELELLAPAGLSRRDLAASLAGELGATVHRIWLPQSEPSLVEGQPIFENLTLGFELRDASGQWLLRCVDDLTLQGDLNRQAAPRQGWHRVVSDDLRLLRLVELHCDPEAPLAQVLEPLAALYGTQVVAGAGGMRRVSDKTDLSIAIAAPLPGERERPCEVVSAPMLPVQSKALLQRVCLRAQALGFVVPAESATHVHFDGDLVHDALTVRDLVRLWNRWGAQIKQRLQTNPRCVRLGPFEPEVVALVEQPGFVQLPWEQAAKALKQVKPSKYRDINLRNVVFPQLGKPTVELRVLPTSLDAAQVWRGMETLAAVLLCARQGALPQSEGALWETLGCAG